MITLVTPNKQEEKQPPGREALQQLCDNGATDVALQMIDIHKLQLRIDAGRVVTALAGTELWLNKFITQDETMLRLKADVRLIAETDYEVLITGETGTGKELIARAMIANRETDTKEGGKFIAVNCAGLPEQLIESELFGHVKGSFTGAHTDKVGMMEAAKGGVFFLDEVADLPLAAQGKLLRVLQEKRIRRVGGNNEIEIKCKFVCATKKDLKQLVVDGLFRDDLFARLSTFHLHCTPLANRPNDIEPILLAMPDGKMFIDNFNVPLCEHVSRLQTPFNVRSLQQYVKRFKVLGRI